MKDQDRLDAVLAYTGAYILMMSRKGPQVVALVYIPRQGEEMEEGMAEAFTYKLPEVDQLMSFVSASLKPDWLKNLERWCAESTTLDIFWHPTAGFSLLPAVPDRSTATSL